MQVGSSSAVVSRAVLSRERLSPIRLCEEYCHRDRPQPGFACIGGRGGGKPPLVRRKLLNHELGLILCELGTTDARRIRRISHLENSFLPERQLTKIRILIENLTPHPPVPTLISQYLPLEFEAIRADAFLPLPFSLQPVQESKHRSFLILCAKGTSVAIPTSLKLDGCWSSVL